MKTFSIKTFGCKVNQYESQVIRERLLGDGYMEVSGDKPPSLYVVNTCCVTDRAEKKSRQFINRLKRESPESLLVVKGCSAKKEENKDTRPPFSRGISNFAGRTRAFVKVQDGCDQFCSYCVLPYIRGRSRSRDLQDVLDEVKRLTTNGYREIVLTGIHLGDYDKFSELLKQLEEIPDLSRIRLSSLEPQDVSSNILEIIYENSKICRHLHIPLQSGSDRILTRMNRRYTILQYIELIGNIRDKIHEITLTTDVIVGFPGEGEEDFLATCKAVEDIGFVKVHIFPYSCRPGTAASGFKDIVRRENIRDRVKALRDLAGKRAKRIKEAIISSFQDVLIESTGRGTNGYTSGYMPVKVKGNIVHNELIRVKISGLEDEYLVGEI